MKNKVEAIFSVQYRIPLEIEHRKDLLEEILNGIVYPEVEDSIEKAARSKLPSWASKSADLLYINYGVDV